MDRKGRFLAQRAAIALWAQLMPGEWSLEYTCQVWFGLVLFTNNREITILRKWAKMGRSSA